MTQAKPFRVTRGPIVDGGNCWHPGVYRPGALPDKFISPQYGHFVGEEPEVSLVITDPLPPSDDPAIILDPNPSTQIDVPVDPIAINTATAEQLKIEGVINTNIAAKIVSERDKNGNYADFKNLLDRIPTLTAKATSLQDRFIFS